MCVRACVHGCLCVCVCGCVCRDVRSQKNCREFWIWEPIDFNRIFNAILGFYNRNRFILVEAMNKEAL